MAGCGKTIVQLQDILHRAGSTGCVTTEMRALLGKSEGHLSRALTLAKDAGLVEFWLEPLGRCSNRRRWYAAGFKPKRQPDPLRSAPPIASPAHAEPNGVTRWVDRRFHVERAPRVVDSAQCRPWANFVRASA